MWRKLTILAALAAFLTPSVSLADDDTLSGLWRVSGRVASFSFNETCRLERHGDGLAGACMEGQNGATHPLIGGAITGDKVTWTHKGRFLFKTFNVVYTAVIDGGGMRGELNAAGHSGAFTAARI